MTAATRLFLKVRITRIAGGLLCPYKGLLPASHKGF